MNPVTHSAQVLPQAIDYVRILPEIVLSLFGIIVMLLDPLWIGFTGRKALGAIAFVGSLAAFLATILQA